MDVFIVLKTELTHQNAHANKNSSKISMMFAKDVQGNARLANQKTNVLNVMPTELTHHTVSVQQVLLITVKQTVHLVLTNVTHV